MKERKKENLLISKIQDFHFHFFFHIQTNLPYYSKFRGRLLYTDHLTKHDNHVELYANNRLDIDY